jgi:ribose transport system permease protein
LLGAVNLFLIGYVLATFNFGAVQAFVTQLFYGLILVISLLLTLLVPVVGRYVRFISPFSAFMVLGCIVAGIMLQVSTADTYPAAAVATAPHAAGGELLTRYLLLPPGSGSPGLLPALTPLQTLFMSLAAALALFVLVLRTMVVEATSRRLGAFVYVVVGALIVLLLLVVGLEGRSAPAAPASLSGAGPS